MSESSILIFFARDTYVDKYAVKHSHYKRLRKSAPNVVYCGLKSKKNNYGNNYKQNRKGLKELSPDEFQSRM